MADQRTAEVEKFKLSKDMLDFQKTHKKAKGILEIIQARGFDQLRELQETNQLLKAWRLSYDGLMQAAPGEPVQELPGMNFSPESGVTEPGVEGQQIDPTIRY